MNGRNILAIVLMYCILGPVIFLAPFSSKLVNVIIFLAAGLPAGAYFVKAVKRADARKDILIGELKKELSDLKLEMHVTSNRIWAVSEQLQVNLDENNGFSQQVYALTAEMAQLNYLFNEKINETLNEVREMIQLLEESGKTTLELEKSGKASESVLKTSKSEILEIVGIIREIESTFRMTSEYMNKLFNASKNIEGILDTVNNIAKQTKLLSLNAAIESARAGENGRGFAVVAEEIQKLATESERSVKEIKQLINALGKEITCVRNTFTETGSKVEKGVNCAISIEKNLGRIHESFNSLLEMAGKIITLSESEVRSADNVAAKMTEVEKLITTAEESVKTVERAVFRQMQGIMEVAEMGNRLNNASRELIEFRDTLVFEGLSANSTALSGKINDAFAFIKELASLPRIKEMDREGHREELARFIQTHDFIEAVWSNDIKGRFICSVPEAGIANAKIRDWFQKSIQGEDFCSKVYISAITKNPCITLSVPIFDDNGAVVGVLGTDLKLNGLENA